MTTQNGRSGSHNPRQTLVVVRLKRIAESQPTAWEGETPEGNKIHIAYRFGEVSIDLLRSLPGRPGAIVWEPVARFKPALIEAELDGKTEHDRYALRIAAERSMTSEIHRANEAEMRSRANGTTALDSLFGKDRLIIRVGQLAKWLHIRNRNLDRLIRRGVAGGTAPVEVEFGDGVW
jgi:hypothetical protein